MVSVFPISTVSSVLSSRLTVMTMVGLATPEVDADAGAATGSAAARDADAAASPGALSNPPPLTIAMISVEWSRKQLDESKHAEAFAAEPVSWNRPRS